MKENKSLNRKKSKKDRWLITIALWTIFLSGGFSLFSDSLLRKVNVITAFIILIVVIIIGIIFDGIGVAISTVSIVPFNAMASKKVKGAKIAINLIKNANKVASFCNDVVGDICGIVSGSIGILIAQKLNLKFPQINPSYITVFIGIIIGTLTIVGKAMGKTKAMEENVEITHIVSRIIFFIRKGR